MEWITDRRPELKEATNEGDVWVYDVEADEYLIRNYEEVKKGQPWMEIPPPPSYVYVKPKRFIVTTESGMLVVYDNKNGQEVAGFLPNHGAGVRIAAIYEELMS